MAFAVSTIIAGASLAVAAVGTGYSIYSQNKAAQANSAAAQKQAQIAGLQAENVEVQRKQLNLKTEQDLLQIETNKDVIAQQQAAEDLRQQAVAVDSRRRQREAVRQSIVAQSNSLVAATAQGASNPGTSTLAQVRANNAGQTNTNIVGIMQNQQFSKQLYDINKTISNIYLNAQDANASFVQKSKELQMQSLASQEEIYRLGGQASQNYAQAATYSGNAAIGQGLVSFGNAFLTNMPSINRLTSFFGNPGGATATYNNAFGNTPQPTNI